MLRRKERGGSGIETDSPRHSPPPSAYRSRPPRQRPCRFFSLSSPSPRQKQRDMTSECGRCSQQREKSGAKRTQKGTSTMERRRRRRRLPPLSMNRERQRHSATPGRPGLAWFSLPSSESMRVLLLLSSPGAYKKENREEWSSLSKRGGRGVKSENFPPLS